MVDGAKLCVDSMQDIPGAESIGDTPYVIDSVKLDGYHPMRIAGTRWLHESPLLR